MPRPLSGPVRLSGSQTLYARFDVPRKLHQQAKAAGLPIRTHRSLKTTSMAIARQRWIPVLAELRRETLEAIEQGRRLVVWDVDKLKNEPVWSDGKETPAIDAFGALGLVEHLLNDGRGFDENNAPPGAYELFQQLTGKPGWRHLLEAKEKATTARRGRSLSDGWRHQAHIAINHAEKAGFDEPLGMGKANVKALMAKLDDTGMAPVTRAKTLKLLSGLVQQAVEDDLVEVNPFRLVSFTAAPREEGARRAFTDAELKQLWPLDPAVRVLTCLGLRVSELFSRTRADLELGVLVIADRGQFRVKTRSSRRRVPVPSALLPDLGSILADRRTASTKAQRLRDLVREQFEDPALVPHSFRHTWYTLARRAGIPQDVTAELAGHSPVNRVQGGYGSFPDQVLIEAVKLIHHETPGWRGTLTLASPTVV